MGFDGAHRWIKRGDIFSLRRALDSGMDPDSVANGWTLLMFAAIPGNRAFAELLVSRGANVNHASATGDTALSIAAYEGHLPFVRVLLAGGASTAVRPWGMSLEDLIVQGSHIPDNKKAVVLAALGCRRYLH